MSQHHDRHRQNQMQDTVTQIILFSYCIGSATWKYFEFHCKDQNQHQRQPEFRNTTGHRSNLADRTVNQAFLVPRAPDSKKQCQHKDQHESHSAKQQCIPDSAFDHFQHIHFILIRNAKISTYCPPQPFTILYSDGFMKTKLLFCPCPLSGGHFLCPLAVIRYQWIARCKPCYIEYNYRQKKDTDHKYKQLFTIINPWIFSHSYALLSSFLPGSGNGIDSINRFV